MTATAATATFAKVFMFGNLHGVRHEHAPLSCQMDLVEGSVEHAVGEDRRAISQIGFGDPLEPTLVHAEALPCGGGRRARASASMAARSVADA